MQAPDSNVLVRYLAQDDATQGTLATRLLEERLTRADRGFVSLVVVLETVWVMESRYDAGATPAARTRSTLPAKVRERPAQ